MKELQRLLKEITKFLDFIKEKGQISGYCLIGGMGVGARGFPRAAKDIDFLIDANEELFEKIIPDALKKTG